MGGNMVRASACLLLLVLLLPGCIRREEAAPPDVEAAREALSKGFYLEAETSYERYLQKEPQGNFRREAWDRLLDISLNVKGDVDRSVMLLESMVLEFGGATGTGEDPLFLLGDLYEQQGNRAKAMETWEKCLKLTDDPEKSVPVRIRLARAQRNQRNFEAAQETLERCSQEASTPALKARCLYESAQNDTFTQSFGRAKTSLEELLALPGVVDETRALAVFLLVDIYEQEGRLPEARNLLESIRETYPNPLVVEARLKSLGKR
ncbi:tetratricopeptide repeat protein [Desulfovibrio aminophilus]|uniref:tetratricopeptide repeat protein n=1 Tax=Desulfovibrio aminophilus TaxID=81425 RepID=UPI0033914010